MSFKQLRALVYGNSLPNRNHFSPKREEENYYFLPELMSPLTLPGNPTAS
jgi:hypothetical protein